MLYADMFRYFKRYFFVPKTILGGSMCDIGNFETSVKHYENRYDWIELNVATTLQINQRIQFECECTYNAHFMGFIAKEEWK